jgi:hypothetical protein
MTPVKFDSRYQGPFGSVNGGYLAGVLADAVGESTSSVRLRLAVPVDTPLGLAIEGGRAVLRHGNEVLAETVASPDDVAEARAVTIGEALATVPPSFDMGMFANCFVCGRDDGKGLGVHPQPLGDGRFVAVWQPAASRAVDGQQVPARYLRSALDCPGGFAAIAASGRIAVTGSLTTQIRFLPDSDQRLLVVGDAVGSEGRKLWAVTTIFTESREVVATAEAIWVTLDSTPAGPSAVADA